MVSDNKPEYVMSNERNDTGFFEWSRIDPAAGNHWINTGIRTQWEPFVKKLRNGNIVVVVHSSDQRILVAAGFENESGLKILNVEAANYSPAICGTVKIADFSDGRIAWFASGLDYSLMCGITHQLTGPISWNIIGSQISSEIFPISRSYGGIQVFVTDSGNGVAHRWYQPDGWSDWESMGGRLAGGISIQDNKNDLPVLFVRGCDNSIWCREHLVPNGWGEWIHAGGCFREEPTLLRCADQSIGAFVRGFDNCIYRGRFHYNGTLQQDWKRIHGPVGRISACFAGGVEQLFAVSLNGEILMSVFQNGDWGGWINLGGRNACNISAMPVDDRCTLLTLRDTYGNILFRCVSQVKIFN